MTARRDIALEVESRGFAQVENILSSEYVAYLINALERISDNGSVRKRGGIFAVRNLLDVSAVVRELAFSGAVQALVGAILGSHFFPVRGILFDKIPGANWKVPWHQDVTIAVQKRVEAEGFGPWSVKSGVLHVQPPPAILEQMVSVRLHLDRCSEGNGALRVIPTSHRQGRIREEEIQRIRGEQREEICALDIGGALLMRPLLLHASSPSTTPGHRRVIHLDYASVALPNGMRWYSEQS